MVPQEGAEQVASTRPDRVIRMHRRLVGLEIIPGERFNERLEWDRDTVPVETPWGPVRIKRALDGRGRVVRGQPEFAADAREPLPA